MAEQASKRQSTTSLHQLETFHDRNSIANLNVFSDDFALEPFEVCNGSGSSSPGDEGTSQSTASFGFPRRPLASRQSSISAQDLQRSSGDSSEHGGLNDSTSYHPRLSHNYNHPGPIGSTVDVHRATSIPHRPVSSISAFSMPRTQSPYQGATGPSHPYGMYPQEIGITRNPSSATNSTVRMPDRLLANSSGPTQPYGMYPQNTVPEDEIGPVAEAIRPVPGFPGLRQNYQRRIGPEGEEAADLVGPDGYTEQLPPYTRYANDVPPKNALAVPGIPEGQIRHQNQSTESRSRSQPAVSQETLNASDTGDPIRRNPNIDDSLTQLNPSTVGASSPSDQGGYFKERVKQKTQRKVCFGKLPLWLVMIFLFIAAVLLGAVIGGVLGRARGVEQNSKSSNTPPPVTATITATTFIDATPFTGTTTGLPPLPTGTFEISLGSPSVSSQDCLSDSTQRPAWSCSSGAVLTLSVDPDGDYPPNVSFSSNETSNMYRYGAQPPQFQGDSPVNLFMSDKEEPNRGPAAFFQQSFDKVVILREGEFFASASKRWFTGRGEYQNHGVLNERGNAGEESEYAKVTDKPWFCYWNETLLEGFIFVTQDHVTDSTTLDNYAPSIMATSTETIMSAPISTTEYTATSTNRGLGVSSVDSEVATEYVATTTAAAKEHWSKRQVVSSPSSSPRMYPKVVKIEERYNAANSASPYCQQMQIMNNGRASLFGPQYPLHETNPIFASPTAPKGRRGWWSAPNGLEKRSDSYTGCECGWVAT